MGFPILEPQPKPRPSPASFSKLGSSKSFCLELSWDRTLVKHFSVLGPGRASSCLVLPPRMDEFLTQLSSLDPDTFHVYPVFFPLTLFSAWKRRKPGVFPCFFTFSGQKPIAQWKEHQAMFQTQALFWFKHPGHFILVFFLMSPEALYGKDSLYGHSLGQCWAQGQQPEPE